MPLDSRLTEMLRCPACRAGLRVLESDRGLQCVTCGLVYPIVDGIPVMLVEEAHKPEA
jgi:uncharacterized protein